MKQLWFCLLCLLWPQIARSQGFAPEQATQQMRLPPDLQVELVASEPLIRQPVCIEFDDRGRLWCVQYLQYPNPEGLVRIQVDRYSRTEYDRVPPPPPHGPRGADRITILTDTDGDGQMDRGHDFVSGLNLTSGIAFGHGGVFVLNVPYLLFYPDRDRNDVPDSDPEVLLTGFGMQDAHSVANSLAWGPDGWLYGCQGSTVTANIRGIEFQQGVWRYHPRTKQFELFCEGGGNSWGLDFDADGHLLYSTNYGGYVLLHGVQGGNYVKSFAKHGQLHNPHSYGYFQHAEHEKFFGGHVTVGGIVYQADVLPAQYRGRYLAADLLGHGAWFHELVPHGSTFKTRTLGQLLDSRDSWFAPTDVTTGPDGCVYISDWHDARTAHPDPDAQWDRTNGRIYRLAPAHRDPAHHSSSRLVNSELDFSRFSTSQLLAMHGDPNQWMVRRARQELVRRGTEQLGNELTVALMRTAVESAEVTLSRESLWSWFALHDPLFEHNDEFFKVAEQLLQSPHAVVRYWTVRWLGDGGRVPEQLAHTLDRLAERETNVHVRSQLAATAARLPAAQALPIINAHINRDIDLADPHLPLQWWWAVEQHSINGRQEVLRRFTRPTLWNSRLGREVLLTRLVRRYAAEGSQTGCDALLQLLESAPDETARAQLWSPMLAGWLEVPASLRPQRDRAIDAHPLRDYVQTHWQSATSASPELTRLAIAFGNEQPQRLALATAIDDTQPAALRFSALQLLSEFPPAQALESLLVLFNRSADSDDLQLATLKVLARYDDAPLTEALLSALGRPTSASVATQIRELLFSRASSARAWLAGVDMGHISKESVSLEQVRQLAMLEDQAINELVVKHWGKLSSASPEEKLAEVRRLNNDLRAAAGDPAAGQLLFQRHCATCHRLHGQGGAVGPDLTSANRSDRDFLLISLVDPNSVIRKEYLSTIVQTTDGRILTGIATVLPDGSLQLVTAKNESMRLAADEVAETRSSSVSIMPEDLYKQLTPQELRDLLAYLMHP